MTIVDLFASELEKWTEKEDLLSAIDYLYLHPAYREHLEDLNPAFLKNINTLDDRVYDLETPPGMVDALLSGHRARILLLAMKAPGRYTVAQAKAMLDLLGTFQEQIRLLQRLTKRRPIHADKEMLAKGLHYYLTMRHGPHADLSHYTLDDFPYHLAVINQDKVED